MSHGEDSSPPKGRSNGEQRADPSSATEAAALPRDIVFVHGKSERGRYQVIRQRDQQIEIGEMTTVREGQPILGDLVKLHPLEQHERLFACETIVKSPVRNEQGPAQVASEAYRSGWEAIFGDRCPLGEPSELN
ncbi:MAG: hypothetical protein VB934_09670 [Polyangiaceae bacterium]